MSSYLDWLDFKCRGSLCLILWMAQWPVIIRLLLASLLWPGQQLAILTFQRCIFLGGASSQCWSFPWKWEASRHYYTDRTCRDHLSPQQDALASEVPPFMTHSSNAAFRSALQYRLGWTWAGLPSWWVGRHLGRTFVQYQLAMSRCYRLFVLRPFSKYRGGCSFLRKYKIVL